MNEKTKKILIIVLAVVLLIVVGVALFFVLNKDKTEKYTLFNDKQEKAIQVSIPQDADFTVKKDEGRISKIEFRNEDKGYRIEILLRDDIKSIYDTNAERHRESDGFKEVEINNFKGYEFNFTSYSKEINLNLGEGKNGHYDIVNIYVSRTINFNEKVDDILELKEVKNIINSIKLDKFVESEEANQNDQVNSEVNNEEVD